MHQNANARRRFPIKQEKQVKLVLLYTAIQPFLLNNVDNENIIMDEGYFSWTVSWNWNSFG